MEEQEEKNEPFRDSIQTQKEESKWKKISIIFIVIAICSLVLLITFMILYFTKDEGKNNSEESETPKSDELEPEDKWKWAPVGDRIKTSWGINLDPKKVLQEYPRPQLQREEWMNLNGPWQYSIRNPEDIDPDEHDGFILVPFPVESSLSGVMKSLGASQVLYYSKNSDNPRKMGWKKYSNSFWCC